jgi:hypothetical protein
MNIGSKSLPLALMSVLIAAAASRAEPAPVVQTFATMGTASFRTFLPADLKPLAASAVVVPAAKPKAAVEKNFAGVQSALEAAAEGLKGRCETARDAGESPFRTMQSFSIKPTIVAAASQRCPDGMKWVCHPWCNETDPMTGKCIFWVPACGCE